MVDIKLKFQASIFLDNKDINPTPEIMTTLLEQFRDLAFITQTFQEIEPTRLAPQTRLRLSSQNEEWDIQFGRYRININKMPSDLRGTNLGKLSIFCSDVIKFYSRISEKLIKKAGRLALISNSLLEEMSQAEFNHIYEVLFRTPSFYKDNPPFEWDWKLASRTETELVGLHEKINVITGLKRTSGVLEAKTDRMPFERIFLVLDINTAPDNSDPRFDLAHIKRFYAYSQALHAELEKSITDFINV